MSTPENTLEITLDNTFVHWRERLEIIEDDDPCPKCGKQLYYGPGGGVVCGHCSYWFCY